MQLNPQKNKTLTPMNEWQGKDFVSEYTNVKCHIYKLNILYVYVFALYFSPGKKKKRETLTFVRIYRYTHNQ